MTYRAAVGGKPSLFTQSAKLVSQKFLACFGSRLLYFAFPVLRCTLLCAPRLLLRVLASSTRRIGGSLLLYSLCFADRLCFFLLSARSSCCRVCKPLC